MDDDFEYTQLSDEDMETFLERRAQECERKKQKNAERERKKRSFRFTGGMI